MKKADFLVIGAVVVVATVLLLVLYGTNNTGAYVEVAVDGTVTQTLPLDTDKEVWIETENGSNLLVIADGKVSVREADCPDVICVRTRAISRNGESIICLPHKVVITVVAAETADDVDAVA